MQKSKTLLAAAVLSLTAIAGHSQTQVTPAATPSPTPVASPTPDPRTGTFNDPKLSLPQRIQLASAILSSGTADPGLVAQAAGFMLTSRPVITLLNAYPNFPDQVIADPTLSGTVTDANAIGGLYWGAISFKVDSTPALADKIAYLQPLLSSTLFTWTQVVAADRVYAHLIVQKAQQQFDAGDYSGAIATATGVLGWRYADQATWIIFRSKVALRSPDVLSWAKLLYLAQDFPHTQAGIDAVSSAYRALDMNLIRANTFIQFQKDGQGQNPLSAVTVPQVSFAEAGDAVRALNAGIGGDYIGALKIAAAAFANAPSGPRLNSATALVAQWLRNLDGNLVRANAFVAAQSQGQPYNIPELSGTSSASTPGTGN